MRGSDGKAPHFGRTNFQMLFTKPAVQGVVVAVDLKGRAWRISALAARPITCPLFS